MSYELGKIRNSLHPKTTYFAQENEKMRKTFDVSFRQNVVYETVAQLPNHGLRIWPASALR